MPLRPLAESGRYLTSHSVLYRTYISLLLKPNDIDIDTSSVAKQRGLYSRWIVRQTSLNNCFHIPLDT